MSIMDELKKLTRPYDDEESTLMDDEDMDLDMDLGEPSYARPAAQTVNPEPAANVGGTGLGGFDLGGLGSMGETPHATVNPINMGGVAGSDSKYRVVLVKPEEFDAATVIAKHICQGETVILNCEDTNEQVARRVIDFLSGCAFALDGSIKKAASNVIIIAPKDVGLDDAKDDEQLDA